MLAVLSPAKNLDFASPLPAVRHTQPQMLDQAQALIEELRELSPGAISQLMSISEDLGRVNYDRYQNWHRPFTKKNARPAVLAFNGGVYQGLAANELEAADLDFAQDHLRILSGLYGILRPLDLMQPYRLEMGTALKTEHAPDLYRFWGSDLARKLNQQATNIGARTLVNLASKEYFKAVDSSKLKLPVIEPVFQDWKKGQYKVISFFAKKARGRMAAYIVKNRLTDIDDLKDFQEDGYAYDPERSSEQRWVYIRRQD